jgi:hypothetical protein
MPVWCPYCNRRFDTNRGLQKHISIDLSCRQKEKAARRGIVSAHRPAVAYLPLERISVHKRARCEVNVVVEERNHVQNTRCSSHLQPPISHEGSEDHDDDSGDITNDFVQFANEDEDDDCTKGPVTIILDDFKSYVQNASQKFLPIPAWWRSGMELLYMLRQTNASLGLYDDVMKWHVRQLSVNQVVHDSILGKEKVFNYLFDRYNMSKNLNIIREITLPSSRARAKIITNSFGWCLQSLLTDPRIVDDDYLFFDDDPLAHPPNNLDYISDINTGKAYTESYKKYITNPSQQVLLPFIFYIDGAATGQFADLPVTPLRFTLGIFRRKSRDRPHFWRTIGYVPVVNGDKSRGARRFHESGHVDSLIKCVANEEGVFGGDNIDKAQDLHSILSILLEEYQIIQERGFQWDLVYKGKTYKYIEFVPYVHIIKCDTEEADRLAGKYTSRTAGVGTLCRYCCCPTQCSDDPLADYPRKTVPMIKSLIENKEEEKLKGISQQLIKNAWYPIRFGAHNDEGVHGAAPLEMLHALLLGIFKYVRDCFFEQVGEKTQLATELNAIAITYSGLYARHSDRDMPITQFSNGIQQGKLMAKEYPGVLLLIATVLRSTVGSKLLMSKKNTTFANDKDVIGDWIELVETLLMWEVWLNSNKISKRHVKRAERKHRFIMYMLRKTANRQAGMGLKLTKFHAIVHMANDMLHFGVPLNFDTGSDEAGHKPMKKAAKVTQRRKNIFEEQVGDRMAEVHALDLAKLEMTNGLLLWRYLDGFPHSTSPPPKKSRLQSKDPHGTVFGFLPNADGQRQYGVLDGDVKGIHNAKIATSFIQFVEELQDKVAMFQPDLRVYSTIIRNYSIFRGTPWYHGGPWYDWVMVNWGDDDGMLPAKIWGFVDFRLSAPPHNDIVYGGINLEPSVYAVVESAMFCNVRNEVNSEIFRPITTEVGGFRDRRVSKLKFYLADVEAFEDPLVVVPDIEGDANRYLLLKSRRQWVQDFEKWLDRPYEHIPDEHE